MMFRIQRVSATAIVAVAASVAALAPSASAASFPSLRAQLDGASSTLPTTALSTTDLQLLTRTSASSLEVGYPATRNVESHGRLKPVKTAACAKTTYHLRLVADQRDALTIARADLPGAQLEGSEALSPSVNTPLDPAAPLTPSRAWREKTTIQGTFKAERQGVSVDTMVLGGKRFARILTTTSRIASKVADRCATGSAFQFGPTTMDLIRLG
jgi:hypothetical protein